MGLILGLALLTNNFTVKREIDVLDIIKVTLLAALAVAFERYQKRRDRVEQGEREQLLMVIDDAMTKGSRVVESFRAADIGPRGSATAESREKIVAQFDALDSTIYLLDRMLYDCSCGSEKDTFNAANEDFNDAVSLHGLNDPKVFGPKVLETHRDLQLALWRTRLRVVRR